MKIRLIIPLDSLCDVIFFEVRLVMGENIIPRFNNNEARTETSLPLGMTRFASLYLMCYYEEGNY